MDISHATKLHPVHEIPNAPFGFCYSAINNFTVTGTMQQSSIPFLSSNSLFDTLDTWKTDPRLAYASWLSEKNLKKESRELYQWMFGRFLRFLDAENSNLFQADVHHIQAFLDAPNDLVPEHLRNVGSRARHQYVRNLERVFDHLGTLGRISNNPARTAIIRRVVGGRDKPTRFLMQEERVKLIAYVKARLDVLRSGKVSIQPEFDFDEDLWLEIRDLALLNMMFGGGVKVGDMTRVKLCCMDLHGRYIDLSRSGRACRARLLDFAIEPLHLWENTLRKVSGGHLAPSQILFPGKKVGFGERSKSPTLSPSSIFRRIERLLGHAGISGDRTSPQTLRNAYAAILIDQGVSLQELAYTLGLSSVARASQLQVAYKASQGNMMKGS
jgi:site-specific recombinase XerD